MKRPPASSTTGCSAARSHSDTSGSQEASTAPSATSTCDQKSPYARVRHTRCDRSSRPGRRPCSCQPGQRGVRQRRVAEVGDRADPQPRRRRLRRRRRRRPCRAPPTSAGPSAGALTTPDVDRALDLQGDERRPHRAHRARSSWCRRPGRRPTGAGRRRPAPPPRRAPRRWDDGSASVRRTAASTAVSASLTGVRSGLARTCRSSGAEPRQRVGVGRVGELVGQREVLEQGHVHAPGARSTAAAPLTGARARATRCGRRSRRSC